MAQNSNILQELTELKSTLAEFDSQNAYTVPEGYFEGLADQVLNRIKALEINALGEVLGSIIPFPEYAFQGHALFGSRRLF